MTALTTKARCVWAGEGSWWVFSGTVVLPMGLLFTNADTAVHLRGLRGEPQSSPFQWPNCVQHSTYRVAGLAWVGLCMNATQFFAL